MTRDERNPAFSGTDGRLSTVCRREQFMTWAMFIQHGLNGLTLGSLYALIAIGYTMVYGILRLINFAHSEIFMLGAYFVLWCLTLMYLPWVFAIVAAIVITASIGILVDR